MRLEAVSISVNQSQDALNLRCGRGRAHIALLWLGVSNVEGANLVFNSKSHT